MPNTGSLAAEQKTQSEVRAMDVYRSIGISNFKMIYRNVHVTVAATDIKRKCNSMEIVINVFSLESLMNAFK
jgi:hypothetical protein